jgi:uncharacterized protein (TIGR02246 family)
MNRLFIVSLLFVATAVGQTGQSETSDQFQNLDFALGSVGDMPPGWHLGKSDTPSYTARTAAGASCLAGQRCGMLQSVGLGPHERCFLYQNVDATPYRGKVLLFRATARVTAGGLARLVVRVHRPDNSSTFFDNLGDHPIQSAQWHSYQIVFPIDDEARDIEFGIQLYGEGAAWIDQIYMNSPIVQLEKEIRDLFREFNEARDALNGHALAQTYSETGEYISLYGQRFAGRANLEQMWSTVDGKAKRTIQKIDVLTPDLAVVRTTVDFDNATERLTHDETFMLVKETGGWRIRVHQAMKP